jgi:hypothetical protein
VPEKAHWGGLALQGPATAGSRLSYVDVVAGTRPELSFFTFSGMLSIHDTHDVAVSHAQFARNEKSDDALHVAYVDGFSLTDTTFQQVLSDAADIEYSSGKLARIEVIGAGDDGLDLMGSRIEIADSQFIKCKDNGVSIGEQSDVTAVRNLMARGGRAFLVKNASSLTASEILGYDNGVGIRLEHESSWYVGTSSLRLDRVHVVRTPHKFDGSLSTTAGRVIEQLAEDDLANLRRDSLKIRDWNALDGALDRLEELGGP